MNEAEFLTLPGAANVPVYDDDDDRCEELDRLTDPKYTSVCEATLIEEARDYSAKENFVLSGGIRYPGTDDGSFVHAYYLKKRAHES